MRQLCGRRQGVFSFAVWVASTAVLLVSATAYSSAESTIGATPETGNPGGQITQARNRDGEAAFSVVAARVDGLIDNLSEPALKRIRKHADRSLEEKDGILIRSEDALRRFEQISYSAIGEFEGGCPGAGDLLLRSRSSVAGVGGEEPPGISDPDFTTEDEDPIGEGNSGLTIEEAVGLIEKTGAASGVGRGYGEEVVLLVDMDAGEHGPDSLTPDQRRALEAEGVRSFCRAVQDAGDMYRIRPGFLLCVMRIESAFDIDAVSRAGAIGIMQLMPSTAADLQANPYDLRENILAGSRLIDRHLRSYSGNVALAMAAYNAGPGSVEKYEGVPPYPETKAYVKRVLNECGDPRP